MPRTALLLLACAASTAAAQRVHQLPATPSTVAYGYYWSQAKPALTIASGDIVEVETMLTNSPAGLERMGVKPEDVPPRLRELCEERGSRLIPLDRDRMTAEVAPGIVVPLRPFWGSVGDGHAAPGDGAP